MLSDAAYDAAFAAMSKFATSSTARKVTLLAVLAVLLGIGADPVAAVRCGPGPEELCQV